MGTLREFLEGKSRLDKAQERRKRRQEWQASVNNLMGQFQEWLKAADTRGVLEIYPFPVEKYEEELGRYEGLGLSVRLIDQEAKIVPVGRNVVGYVRFSPGKTIKAEGRVDIRAGGVEYVLYRTLEDGKERWYALNDRYEPAILDQAKFEAIMQELLS